MRKIQISGAELTNWMDDTFTLFASQTCDNMLLRMWVNHHGIYKVVFGDEVLYKGNQRTQAIEAWDNAGM